MNDATLVVVRTNPRLYVMSTHCSLKWVHYASVISQYMERDHTARSRTFVQD
jgi:hypothetical protein